MADFSTDPYFDDYNEEKGFYKILFIPEVGVQVRELNQLQTMLHEQIKRHGNHTFDNGSVVIPGEINYDLNYSYAKVTIQDLENIENQLSNVGNKVIGQQTGVEADLVQYVAAEGEDPATFYLLYTNSGDNEETNTFADSEGLSIINAQDDAVGLATVIETGVGSKATINSGVYYINGYFVANSAQTILLDKYGTEPSCRIGFTVRESNITATQDDTLYDNANGQPNYTAPGAHRYKIEAVLEKYDEGQEVPDSFVDILTLLEGEVERKARGPEYNELEDVMARRTYDESGDYTVKPFGLVIREHLKNADQSDGVYTAEKGGDASKIALGVEDGSAYVRGYHVSNALTRYIATDKARETDVMNNASISMPLGFYIEIEQPNIIPSLSSLQKVQFYDGAISGSSATGSVLGSAHVRSIRKEQSVYRLYIFNIRDNNNNPTTSFLSDTKSVYSTEGQSFSANVVGDSATLHGTDNYKAVFRLPANNVRSLLDEFGNSDTSYQVIKQYEVTADSSGNVVINAGSNETFVAQDSVYGFASPLSGTNEVIDISSIHTLGGTPVGKTITINFGAGYDGVTMRINLQVAVEVAQSKAKTLTTGTLTTTPSGDRYSLKKADAVRIVSVTDDDDNDVTGAFALEPNRTPAYYGVSYITKTDANVTVANPVTIEFEYFEHGTGNFFSVDSYTGVNYEDIPVDYIDGRETRLTDVVDFRPRIDDNNANFSDIGANVSYLPVPYSIFRSDVEFYMDRIDKVFVTSDGEFGVARGVPGIDPKEPDAPDDSMVLYTVNIPAYTASADDVQAKQIKNNRYTMKDIGKLEQRIENLEYYVSLNLLEQDTANLQIVDPTTGLNRFKNGFLVDSFVDHSVGDYTWSYYKCSVSPTDKNLRPEFSMDAIDVEINETSSSHYVVKDDIAMLPYSEVKFIEQDLATESMNVNPYAVFRWFGEVKLNPSVDSWFDTVYTSPDVTYRVFNNGNLTQTWNSNQLNWSGRSSTTTRVEQGSEFIGFLTSRFDREITTTDVTTISVAGDRVVNTNVIPFMRTRDVRFNGKALRPNSRVYVFFDDVDVTQYCRPDGGSFGDRIVTNSKGEVSGVFRIPNNQEQKFRTGTRVFTLIDNPENSEVESQSFGQAAYTANGVLKTRQKSIMATRTINTTVRRIERTRNIGFLTQSRWRDPLAQSFLVEKNGGIFLSSVDLYFETKDPRVPVQVEVRTMENGMPTNEVVPGSLVTLHPEDVNTSSDSSVATRFEFDAPIHLMDGEEYCFVVLSNSTRYNLFVAEMSAVDIRSNKAVGKQPYIGVMFKSQNASTWTEDQTRDIKFKLNRASFDTSSNATLVLNNQDTKNRVLRDHPLYTENGSSNVMVYMVKHNMIEGSRIEISNAVGGNGIDASVINTAHDVVEVVDFDRFIIDVGSAATTSGYIGGNAVECTTSIMASEVTLTVDNINLPETSFNYAITGQRGKSFHGNEVPHQPIGYDIPLSNDETTRLPEVLKVGSAVDEAANYSGNKSVSFKINMGSQAENVSPIVDLQGTNIATAYFEVDNNTTEDASGENCWAKYRTRVTGLSDPANSLKTFADIQKPQEATVLVSYRVGNTEEEVIDSDWTMMDDISVLTTADASEYLENEYGAEDLSDFTYFQVMVQMKSSSSVKIPMLKRFRTIALGT